MSEALATDCERALYLRRSCSTAGARLAIFFFATRWWLGGSNNSCRVDTASSSPSTGGGFFVHSATARTAQGVLRFHRPQSHANLKQTDLVMCIALCTLSYKTSSVFDRGKRGHHKSQLTFFSQFFCPVSVGRSESVGCSDIFRKNAFMGGKKGGKAFLSSGFYFLPGRETARQRSNWSIISERN